MNELVPQGTGVPFEEQDTDILVPVNFEQINPPDRVTSHQGGKFFILPAEGSVTLGRSAEGSQAQEGAAEQRRVAVPGAEHVSREHLNLYIENGKLTIFDKGSTNGTWLNGERLPNRHSEADMGWKPYDVQVGDLLVIAGEVFYRVKQEKGRWVLEQETPPAQRVAEKIVNNRDHVRVGANAFEALPFSQSLAEFLTLAEISLPFVLPEHSAKGRGEALNRLKMELQMLIGEQKEFEHTRNVVPENILMSAMRDITSSKDQKWQKFAESAKFVINRERAQRNLVQLTFSTYEEPLANIWKKKGEHAPAPESEKEQPFLVGESLYNKYGPQSLRRNQDAAFSLPSGAVGIFDGMSSAYDGAAAAEITKDTYKEVLSELPPHPTSKQVQEAYQLAMTLTVFRLQERRNALSDLGDQAYMDWRAENTARGPGNEQPILGTTAASGMIVQERGERKLVYSYSGDSRIYVLKKSGEVRCITLDHNTFVLGHGVPSGMTQWQLQERFDNVKGEDELKDDPELLELFELRNVVTQDISEATFDANLGVNTNVYTLEADDVGFFCTSDGVHDNLTKDEIDETMISNLNDTQEMPAVRDEQLTVGQKMRRRLDGMLTGLQKRFGKEASGAKPELSLTTLRKRVKDIADRAYDVSQLPAASHGRAKSDDISLAFSLDNAA